MKVSLHFSSRWTPCFSYSKNTVQSHAHILSTNIIEFNTEKKISKSPGFQDYLGVFMYTHTHTGFTYLNTWTLFIQHRQIKDVEILSFILIKVECS